VYPKKGQAVAAMGWTEGQVDVSDIAVQADDLASQYVARVEQDLTENAEEQERIDRDIKALQQRFNALQRDRTVLLGVRMALRSQGGEAPAPSTSAVHSAEMPNAEKLNEEQAASTQPVTPKTHEVAKASKITLVDLVCSHLSSQSEPRSAAEVSMDIAQNHPDRTVKITVVRATLEALVAQGRVRRTKQGRSVFYHSTTPVKETPTAN
jgi:glycerol-3-phosphate cytidylyltransferase-like family protein